MTTTKVLSIVGPGRSGSTIIASVLGEVPSVVSAGEVRWLWRRGVLDQRPCGCGEPPARCTQWSPVLEHVFAGRCGPGGGPETVLKEVLDAQREVAARRNRLRVLRSASTTTTTWPSLSVLRAVTAEAVGSLACTTGSDLVVDTSKRAQDAAVLAGSRSVDHFVLHLVRDPRAVAYSWGRAKSSTTDPDARKMGTRGPVSSASRWMENAIGAELLRRRLPADRWMDLRYEDFVAAPAATIAAVLGFVGIDRQAPFISADTVILGANHIVAGNPSRFRTGEVRIREDDEWMRRMAPRDRLWVDAIVLPLLARYRYPLRTTTEDRPAD